MADSMMTSPGGTLSDSSLHGSTNTKQVTINTALNNADSATPTTPSSQPTSSDNDVISPTSNWTAPVHSSSQTNPSPSTSCCDESVQCFESPRTQRCLTTVVTRSNHRPLATAVKTTRSTSSVCRHGNIQSRVTESYGGLEYSFVEEIPNELLCSVCTKVFQEPHLTDCCGHHYCHSCLQHWIAKGVSDTCPSCRSHDFNHIHDKKLERQIHQLKIQCTNSDLGCEWVGPLSELDRHLNVGGNSVKGCQFVLCECENECGGIMLRKEITVHLQATCPLREVTCEHCKEQFTYHDIVKYHIMSCGEKLISCEKNCGEVIKRKQMKSHLEEACPNEVKECPFVDVGCQESVMRKNFDRHIVICKETHLTKAFIKMKAELTAQKEELAVAKEENQLLRKEFVRLKKGVVTSHNNLDILRRHGNTMRDIISRELPFLHTSCESPSEQLALECVKTQISDTPVLLRPGQGCASFRMTDYAIHKETGQVWYTPSFHVANGYTLCFGVHLNGVGAGKGTHVSVYLYQLTGLYDNELKWPYLLEEDFEVCLMRQTELSGRSRSPRRSVERSKFAQKLSPKIKPKVVNSEIQANILTLPAEFGEREVELVNSKCKSLASVSPTLARQTSSNRDKETQRDCPFTNYIIENQVLCVTQNLSRPVQSRCNAPVSKLELYCLQKTVETVVYRDSVVFQCRLRVKQDTVESPPPLVVVNGLDTSGWKTWSGDDVQNN